jgi:hypothetical protein
MFNIKRSIALTVFLGLSACYTGGQAPIPAYEANTKVINSLAQNLDVTNSDGASISVILDFNNFTAKANSNGILPRQPADVASVKLYLTTSATDPLNPSALIFTSNILTFSGTAKTYTFQKVQPGGPYFVAAELFDAGSVNIVEPVSYGGTTGTMGLTVSGNPVPSVTVNANATTSHHNSLTINPVLKNGSGAKIETNIAPLNGIFTGPVTASFNIETGKLKI